ncbi:MAG: hypothetical protein Hens3KO_22450 [Henriciella sp.]
MLSDSNLNHPGQLLTLIAHEPLHLIKPDMLLKLQLSFLRPGTATFVQEASKNCLMIAIAVFVRSHYTARNLVEDMIHDRNRSD